MIGGLPIYRAKLHRACVQHGVSLDGCVAAPHGPVNGAVLLWALAGIESDYGRLSDFARHETAYMPGGTYYRHSTQLRALWERYGVLAACSLGPFQIMLPTAVEMGYDGPPHGLLEPFTAAEIAARLILKRHVRQRGAKLLAEVFDAYNSGTHRDAIVPEKYIKKGLAAYRTAVATWPVVDHG